MAESIMSENKLSKKVMAGYGVCDLGGNLFFTAIAIWLMIYLTDTVGIEALWAGAIVAIGKIWDAVTDPVVGYLSDRTKSKMGRRRPYILFGSVPLFIATIVLFTNPALLSSITWSPKDHQTLLFIWGIVAFCFLNTTYTVVNIPYSSMTPELTQDFHERTVLNGYRFGFAVIGTLLAAGAAAPIINSFADKNIGFMAMGTIFGGIMMITALITFFSVKEPDVERKKLTKGFFETYFKVFKNKPYLIILFAYALHITAITVVMSVAAYYFKYLHNDTDLTKTTLAMVILLVTAMLFIPVSVLISKKLGKKIVYAMGMLIFSFAVVVMFFIGHKFPIHVSYALMFIGGIGIGFTYVPPYAMLPDTVEYDYLISGERTEGAFYSIWTFMLKIGQAIALAITGVVLHLTGYVKPVGEEIIAQTDLAQFGIRLLIGPVGAFIFVMSVIVLYFYPINEERYEAILKEIKIKEAGK